MTPGQFHRIRTLFDAASELSESVREEFLASECSDDPDVFSRVRRLLGIGSARIDAVERKIRDTLDTQMEQQLGPYRLIRQIGEGGMGEVWLAEQDPPLQRLVAVKVIKAGFDTRQVAARFELERQALAIMSHPGIACIYDAGSTPRGRPYFAMEYVPGEPIDQFCDEIRLSINERLRLFRQVCDAVSHAHRKAIIHRDLKPSNILITSEAGVVVPKIIDFGIAKAISGPLSGGTLLTELGKPAGTLEYMSPEQQHAGEHDIDTRTDVFGLGVVLYELLTGRLPFYRGTQTTHTNASLMNARFERPSQVVQQATDLSAIARTRNSDERRLIMRVKGDLDWVVLKALEFDVDRRYESVDALASDIDRFLEARPVQARPPSWSYVTGRFVRRHRFGVAASALLTVAVIAGIVGTVTGLERAKRAEILAREEATVATQTLDFLVDSFSLANPLVGGNRELSARQMLDASVERLQTSRFDDSTVEATLRRVIGGIYGDLALYDEAIEQLELSLVEPGGAVIPDGDAVRSRQKLAEMFWARGPVQKAESLQREVVEDLRRLFGATASQTLEAETALASILYRLGRDDEALELVTHVLDADANIDALIYSATSLRASLAASMGDLEQSERLARQVVRDRRLALGDEHMATKGAELGLASILAQRGRFQEAQPILEDLYQVSLIRWGPKHKGTFRTLDELGEFERLRGNMVAADEHLTRARAGFAELLTRDHPDLLRNGYRLGSVRAALGRRAEAAKLLADTLRAQAKIFGRGHAITELTSEALTRLCGVEKRGHARPARALSGTEPGLPECVVLAEN